MNRTPSNLPFLKLSDWKLQCSIFFMVHFLLMRAGSLLLPLPQGTGNMELVYLRLAWFPLTLIFTALLFGLLWRRGDGLSFPLFGGRNLYRPVLFSLLAGIFTNFLPALQLGGKLPGLYPVLLALLQSAALALALSFFYERAVTSPLQRSFSYFAMGVTGLLVALLFTMYLWSDMGMLAAGPLVRMLLALAFYRAYRTALCAFLVDFLIGLADLVGGGNLWGLTPAILMLLLIYLLFSSHGDWWRTQSGKRQQGKES